MISDAVDLDKSFFSISQVAPANLDEGFDVYATQTFNGPGGKAYAVSWVGLPDISHPTDKENWAHCLSQVKQLTIKNGQLYQHPVPAMANLRINGRHLSAGNKSNRKIFLMKRSSKHFELKLTISA